MKIRFLAAAFVFASSLYGLEINKEEANRLGLCALASKASEMDKELLGKWYLYNMQKSKYDNVRNDEFELDGAINEGYELFMKLLDKNKECIGRKFSMNLSVRFGEYDFKNQRFPLDFLSKDSYITFYGNNLPTGYITAYFENANPDKNYLPMSKEEASKFVKARKNDWGDVNRELVAKVEFHVTEIEITGNLRHYYGTDNYIGIKTNNHIDSVKIVDGKGREIYDFKGY